MKTSVMDKIRILRSNRRKTDPKKGRPLASAPLVVSSHPSQLSSSETTQQWVPVLVLNITKPNTSPATTAALPSSYTNTDTTQDVAIKTGIWVEKNSPISTCPPENVSDTQGNIIFQCNNSESKQSLRTLADPVVNPTSSGIIQTPDTEEPEKADQDAFNNHVKCILCDMSFPSLQDMQVHYLNIHKSRRGKDSRKAKINSDTFTSQTNVDGETCSPGQKNEPSLPVSEKGEVDPKCPVCSIDYPTAEEVKKHMKEVHSYVCSECSSTFYSLFQFTNHKCTKVVKKVKRNKKKGTVNMITKLPLNSEATKIMNSFVQIKPKTKKNSKVPSRKLESSPTPPSQERLQQPVTSPTEAKQINMSETYNEKHIIVPQCGSTASPGSEFGEEASSSPPELVVEAERDPLGEDESTFLPSIETIYSLKSPCECKSEGQNYSSTIPVIETKNLEQAKQYLQNTQSPEPKIHHDEMIRTKIAQLKRNPHVTLSWRPSIPPRSYTKDGDYVCGRCNVLCDDMEDYMDHIQDCFTMSSVTLEPVPTPPRRLLKLPCQTIAFGSRESGHNRYLINQNLVAKLEAYLPNPISKNIHHLNHLKPSTIAQSASSGLTSRDPGVLDDFNGSQESSDIPTSGSASPVSPSTRHSEVTHFSREVLPSVQEKVHVSPTIKGTSQPMVMIPVDSNIKLSVAPDHQPRSKVSDHSQYGKETTKASSSKPLPGSPLGLLLDQDEIKMEVEEEVVEDHFENS